MLRKIPLVVILGSTGTGKTKLSLELAERFGGEIISADSMQVYANLDIATAKATKEEQSKIKHHLLDVATPDEPFTVFTFRNKALPIIENLSAQSKCPIVVGGTNYYIESILWDILLPSCSDNLKINAIEQSDIPATKPILSDSVMSTMSSAMLHEHLMNIDPDSANRIHPNNKRKIVRAIEYYQQSGHTLTSKLQEQRQQPGGNRLGGPLRYPHTILLWLRCNQEILNNRLDKRVDGMLEQGLLREIRSFHNKYKELAKVADFDDGSTTLFDANSSYTKGILQTIGFKEFIPYMEKFNAENDEKIEEYLKANAYKMPTEEQFKAMNSTKKKATDLEDIAIGDSQTKLPTGLETLYACLNELKLVTRRYSKKQMKWINNRFLASRDRQVPDLYELDTSDVTKWHQNVYVIAENIIDSYRNGQICEIEPMKKIVHPGAGLNEETSNFCSICERHFIGEYQWHLHQKSNKHKRRKEGLRKKEKLKLNLEMDKIE